LASSRAYWAGGNTAILGGPPDNSGIGAAWIFVQPALQVNAATNIFASGTHGGPFSPSSFRYTLSPTFGSVSYSVTNVPSWLTVSSKSGTVTTSAKTITFTVNSSARSLGPGTYTDNIGFNNTTNNQGNTTRVATLLVTPKQYTLTVRASPLGAGTESGGGTFAEGSSRTSRRCRRSSGGTAVTGLTSFRGKALPRSLSKPTKPTSVPPLGGFVSFVGSSGYAFLFGSGL
jgi:Viral BACON domain